MGQAEGDEEQSGLVNVAVVAVDDVDLRLVGVEAAAQTVGGHRPARPAADDHDLLPAHDASPIATGTRPVAQSRRSMSSTNSMPASIERRSGHAWATLQTLQLCVAEVAAELNRDLESAR